MPRVLIGPKHLLPSSALTSEAEMWRALAGGDDVIVASESPLSKWARSVAQARGWNIQVIEDPRDRIAREYPSLQAHLDELLPAGAKHFPDSLWAWVEQKWPDIPRHGFPSKAHAEALGRWRLSRTLTPGESALLAVAAQDIASPDVADAYSFATTASAEELVEALAGVGPNAYREEWSTAETSLRDTLATWTRSSLAAEGFSVLKVSLTGPGSKSAKTAISKAFVAICDTTEVPRDAKTVMRPFLTTAEFEKLSAQIEPDLPLVPDGSKSLGQWYESSYLPYRTWMHARGEPPSEQIEQVWSGFVDVLLPRYRKAIGTGDGDLAFIRSRELRKSNERTLLVVLDGPLPSDVQRLQARLNETDSGWSVVAREWALAPLPTLTEVCRPSIVCGKVATSVIDEDAAVTSFAKARAELESGSGFSVVKLTQPDKAYHTLGEPPERLRRLAGGFIDIAAEELMEIISAGVCDVVVITADHGRCFGPCDANVPLPETGQAQGRCVLGVERNNSVPEGRALRLDGELYGFSQVTDAVVALGSSAFVGSKQVWYLHGGLLPEEVFVPWLVLRPVKQRVIAKCSASITGVLNKPGELSLTIVNSSSVGISLVSIALHPTGEPVAFSHATVPPAASWTGNVPLQSVQEQYPSVVKVLVETPDQVQHALDCDVTTTIRQMQSQNIDLLDDL